MDELTTTQQIWKAVADNNDALLQAQEGLRTAMNNGDEQAQKRYGDQIRYLETMMAVSAGPAARRYLTTKTTPV